MAVSQTKRSDFSVRSDRVALVRELRDIIRNNRKLDDAFYIIQKSLPELKRDLQQYSNQLKRPLLSFFVTDNNIDKLVADAQKDFIQSLIKQIEQGKLSLALQDSEALVSAVKQGLESQVLNIVNEIEGRQFTKISRFKLLKDQFLVKAEQTAGQLFSRFLNVGDGIIDKKEAVRLWDFLNGQFGQYDKVIYRNGTHYPIDAWAQMRSITVSQEVQRVASSIEASRNRILTGKVSSHGSSDSCLFHEGEIIFYSQRAKEIYKRDFPNDKRFLRMRTLQDLENDKTHIFKPNCKHLVRPFPLQFFDDKDRQETLDNNKIRKIPKKINEKKLIEKNEKKFEKEAISKNKK